MRTRSWWGWGWTEEALPDDECVALAALLPGLANRPLPVPVLDLKDPRVRAPSALRCRVSAEPADRAGHTYGKAYRDVMRALRVTSRKLQDARAQVQQIEQKQFDLRQ